MWLVTRGIMKYENRNYGCGSSEEAKRIIITTIEVESTLFAHQLLAVTSAL